MLMSNNRVICVRKKHFSGNPPTRCSLNVDRSLISGLDIIMASLVNAAKRLQINREKHLTHLNHFAEQINGLVSI